MHNAGLAGGQADLHQADAKPLHHPLLPRPLRGRALSARGRSEAGTIEQIAAIANASMRMATTPIPNVGRRTPAELNPSHRPNDREEER